MKAISVLFGLLYFVVSHANAQSIGIGGSSFTPHASSILELQSSGKGILIPRMATLQRNGINTPALGLIIFNTQTNHFEYWNGTLWIAIMNENDDFSIPGSNLQTLRHNGTTWVANDLIRNNGISVGLGMAPDNINMLSVFGIVKTLGLSIPTGAGSNKVWVSTDNTGIGSWVDPALFCDVCDPPPSDAAFIISENDSSLIAPRSPSAAANSFVVGSQIIEDPDILVPVEWEGRMFFDAATTNAFRAGTSNNGAWNPVNLGVNSFATGYNSKASGLYSVSMGQSSVASDTMAIALGLESIASKRSSIAIGTQSSATAIGALGIGFQSSASGTSSIAIGNNASASKGRAFAMGNNTQADGIAAFAMGNNTIAKGDASFALGNNVEAKSGFEVIVGRFESPHTPAHYKNWIATDRLFSVANGTSDLSRSDAFVVRKNGRAGIGSQTTSAQLHVSGLDGIVVTGTHGSGADIEVSGTGTRMLFNPKKSAFRAGSVISTR